MAPTFYYVLSYLFKKTKTPLPHQEAYFFFPVDHDDPTVFWCQVRLGDEDNIKISDKNKMLSNFIMNKRYKDSR